MLLLARRLRRPCGSPARRVLPPPPQSRFRARPTLKTPSLPAPPRAGYRPVGLCSRETTDREKIRTREPPPSPAGRRRTVKRHGHERRLKTGLSLWAPSNRKHRPVGPRSRAKSATRALRPAGPGPSHHRPPAEMRRAGSAPSSVAAGEDAGRRRRASLPRRRRRSDRLGPGPVAPAASAPLTRAPPGNPMILSLRTMKRYGHETLRWSPAASPHATSSPREPDDPAPHAGGPRLRGLRHRRHPGALQRYGGPAPHIQAGRSGSFRSPACVGPIASLFLFLVP